MQLHCYVSLHQTHEAAAKFTMGHITSRNRRLRGFLLRICKTKEVLMTLGLSFLPKGCQEFPIEETVPPSPRKQGQEWQPSVRAHCTGGPWLHSLANPRGRRQTIQAAGRAGEEVESGPSNHKSELMKCFSEIHTGWQRPGAAPHVGFKKQVCKCKGFYLGFLRQIEKEKKILITLHRPHAPQRSWLLAFHSRVRKNTGISDQFACSRPFTESTSQNNPIMAAKV